MANVFRVHTVKLSDASTINSGQLISANSNLTVDFNNLVLTGGQWSAQGLNISGNSVITTAQTGAFGGVINTGQLTGAFYPLNSNPSNYIVQTQVGGVSNLNVTGYNVSGIVVVSGFSGVQVTTGSATQILIGFNNNLFVSPSSTGQFITTGQTGAFGLFNTGTLVGTFALLSGTNIFSGNSYTIGNDVYTGSLLVYVPNLISLPVSGNNSSGIGLLLGNPSLGSGTSGAGFQVSPSLYFSGNYYTTGAGFTGSTPSMWRIYATGTTGVAGTVNTYLKFDISTNGLIFSPMFNIEYNGSNGNSYFNTPGNFNFNGGNFNIPSLTSNTITNPSTGPMYLTNNNATTVTQAFWFGSNVSLVNMTAGNFNYALFTGNYSCGGGNANIGHLVTSPSWQFTGPQSGNIYDLRTNSTSANLSGASHYLFDASNSGTSAFCVLSSGGNGGLPAQFTGYVGINQPNPKSNLHVSGSIRFDGTSAPVGVPNTTGSPVAWFPISVSGSNYYLPLYQ